MRRTTGQIWRRLVMWQSWSTFAFTKCKFWLS